MYTIATGMKEKNMGQLNIQELVSWKGYEEVQEVTLENRKAKATYFIMRH